jgi:hypothetical protein
VVLHSFKKAKSLGLDGWLVELLIGFYEVIEEDLMRIIEEYRVNGRMLEAFNATFFTFIPKTKKPLSI